MARISIPLDSLTSRLNLQGRLDSVRSQSLTNRFANLRPISEFFDFKRLSKPNDFGDMQARVNHNLSYFSSNYAVVFAMLSVYSLITNLLLLFVICLVVGGMYGIGRLQGRDLDLGFVRATTAQLYTTLLIVAVPLGILASPIGTVLWLIGASGVSIIGHASFMEKDIASSFSEEATWPRARDWELQGPAHRFEGSDSTDDIEGIDIDATEDEDGTAGVLVDQNSLKTQDMGQSDFVSDKLYFDGYDLGQARHERRPVHGVNDAPDDDARDLALQALMREHEDVLVRSALDRIANARAIGRTNVMLSPAELDALERRIAQPPEQSMPGTASEPFSPPGAPGKLENKVKATNRSSSTTSLASQNPGNRGGCGWYNSPPTTPVKSSSKTKVSRRPSDAPALPDSTLPPLSASTAIPGPDRVSTHLPLSSFNHPAGGGVINYVTTTPPTRSRSGSKSSRVGDSPSERLSDGRIPSSQIARYYSPIRQSQLTRGDPPSAGRFFDLDAGTQQSTMSSTLRGHAEPVTAMPSAYMYGSAAPSERVESLATTMVPTSRDQRRASGPPEFGYAAPRRSSLSTSPLVQRRHVPMQEYRSDHSSPRRDEVGVPGSSAAAAAVGSTDSDSDSEDYQGVQVELVPTGSGFSINRTPLAASSSPTTRDRVRRRNRR